MEAVSELFDHPKERFFRHLKLENNCRILFSGIYGTGKTYFLNKFFELAKSEYEVIKINPINYSIASNEDIFKYIKYDILLELILKKIEFQSLDFNISEKIGLYVNANKENIVSDVLNVISDLGKNIDGNFRIISAILDFFKNEFVNINKYITEKVDKVHNESQNVDTFIEDVLKLSGNIYEESVILKIIVSKIAQLKNLAGENKKEVILIIDDLDRIDPEHMFRILNIFSSHFDLTNELNENRFGFSKIILVCDILNIRSIFHYKYGLDTNFNGYIDKFYSAETFYFNNEAIISKQIKTIIEHYKVGNLLTQTLKPDRVNIIIDFLIPMLVTQGVINLRSLLKHYDQVFDLDIIQYSGYLINPDDHSLLWQLQLISKIIGGKHAFIQGLNKLNYDKFPEDYDINTLFRSLIFLVTLKEHRLTKVISNQVTRIDELNINISYSTDNINNSSNLVIVKRVLWSNDQGITSEISLDKKIELIPSLIKKGINIMFSEFLLQ